MLFIHAKSLRLAGVCLGAMLGTVIVVGEAAAQAGAYISFGTSAQVRASLNFPNEAAAMAARSATISESDMNAVSGLVELIVLRGSSADSADFAWSGPVDANDLGYRRSDQPAQPFTFNANGILQIRNFTTGPAETDPAADLQLKNDAVVESDETITITLTAAGGGQIDPARATLTLTIIDDDEFAEAPAPSAGFSPVARNQPVGIGGGSVSFGINLQNFFPTNVDDILVHDIAVDVRMIGGTDNELSDIVNGVESENYQITLDDPDTVNPISIRSGSADPDNTAAHRTFALIIPINRFFESSGNFGAATVPLTLTAKDTLNLGETITAYLQNVYFREAEGQINSTLSAQDLSDRLTTYRGHLIATLSPDPEDLARGIRVNGGTARFDVGLIGIPETVGTDTVGGVFFSMSLGGTADNVASPLAEGASIQTADYSITLDDTGSGGNDTARIEPTSHNNMRLQIRTSREYLIARDERISFTIAALSSADPDTTIQLQLRTFRLIDPSQVGLTSPLVGRSEEPVEWDITLEPGAVAEAIDGLAIEPVSGVAAANFGVFTITLEDLPPLLSDADTRRFIFNTGPDDSTLSDATPGYDPAEAGITPATNSSAAPDDEYIFLYISPDGEPSRFSTSLNGTSEGRLHNVLVPKTPDETYTFRIVPIEDSIADDNERALFGYSVSFDTDDPRDVITGVVNSIADSVVIRDSSEAVLSAALTITDDTLAEQAGAGTAGEESIFELAINNLYTDGPDNISVFYQLQGLATPVGFSDAEATDLAVSGAEASFDSSGDGVANLNRGTHINSDGDAVIRFTVSLPGDDGNPADESISLLINCISHAPRGDIPGRGVLMGSAGCEPGPGIDVLLPGESVTGNGAAVTAQDNEFGIILSVSDPTADERNETVGEFTVALYNFDTADNSSVTLTYELGGTATSPDYTIGVVDAAHDTRTRTITIPAANIAGAGAGAQGNAAGNAVATIGITPVNDRIDESDETVTLSITSAPAGALVVPRETGPITIADDDLFSAALTVTDDTLVEQAAQGAEGVSGSFQLTINNLPTDGDNNISIFYQVQGLATEIGFSGQPTILSTSTTTSAPLSGELNPGGEGRIDISLRSRFVTITYFLRVAGDDGNLEDESIGLLINCISRSTRGTLVGSAGCDLGSPNVIEVPLRGASVTGNAAAITVLDDDIARNFGVALSTSDPNAAEADQDTGEFTVVLSDFDTARNFNARLTYELGGTAAPSDYAISVAGAAHDAGANTITIPGENIEGIGAGVQGNAAGAAVATIVITPVDDRIDEDEETVTFSIIASTPANIPLISATTAPVRIADSDTVPIPVTITALDNLAIEPLTAEEEATDFGEFTIALGSLTEAQLATNVRRFFFNPGHNDHDDPVDDLNDIPGYGPPPPGVVPATEDDFIIEYIPPIGDPVAVQSLYPSSGGNGVTIHGTGDIAKISDEIYTFRVTAVHDLDDDSNEIVIFGYRVDFATGDDNDQIRGIENDRNDNAVNIRQGICQRTSQVRDAIVAAINALPAYNGVTCDSVTLGQLGEVASLTVDGNDVAVPVVILRADDFADLPALNNLTIRNNPMLSSLRVDVLDNLPSLLTLRLNNNGLSSLPVGVFDGLVNLRLLSLVSTPVVTSLPAGVLDSALDTLFTVVLDDALVSEISFSGSLGNVEPGNSKTINVTRTAPHATLAVPISLMGGDTDNIVVGDGSGFVVLAAGVSSTAVEIRVALEADLGNSFTLALETPSPSGIARISPGGGVISFDVAGICDRTPQVRNVILDKIPGVSDCALVTRQHLDDITGALNLDNTGINTLRTDDFKHLAALEELHLNDNNLGALPSAVFSDLNSIRILDLGDNQLNALPDGVFDGLTAFEDLTLSGNNLSTLNATVFSGLPSLRALRINGNRLTELPDGLFDDLSSLTRLDLSDNNLGTLPAGVFDELTALTHLGLNAINLELLDSAVFNNLAGLDNLGVAGNNLAALPGDLFHNLPVLKVFRLEDNANPALTELPAGLFDRSSALTWLRLNRTALTSLRADVFNGLDSLDRLSIDGNAGLTELPVGVLDPVLDTVTRLILSSTLTGRIFFEHAEGAARRGDSTAIRVIRTQPHTAVTVAIITGGLQSSQATASTEITFPAGATSATLMVGIDGQAPVVNDAVTLTLGALSLPADTRDSPNADIISAVAVVADTANVHTLDILPPAGICGRTEQVRDAIVAALGVANCGAVTESSLSGLTGTLDLNDMGIITLQARDFDGLTGLTELRLGENSLSTLPSTVFSDLRNLGTLRLQANPLITTLPDGLFDGLTGLTELRLDENSLSTLPSTVFSDLRNLGALHLQANPLITTLPDGLFDGLAGLTTLDLGDNDLEALPDGLFDDLASLTMLDLDGNNLSMLPVGVLTPVLDTLTSLSLEDRLRSIIRFEQHGSVSAMPTASTMVHVIRTQHPHTAVTVALDFGADITGPAEVTIPAGATSATFEVTFEGRTINNTRTIALGTISLPDDTSQDINDGDIAGAVAVVARTGGAITFFFTSPDGICTRTLEVQNAIVAAIPAAGGECGEVLDSDLNNFAGTLELNNEGISTLQAGDFDGLTSLTILDLSENGLTMLPDGIFDSLASLIVLGLTDNNGLTMLPDGIFDELTELIILGLNNSGLTMLPDGIFDELTELTILGLNSNDLTMLPGGIFDNLTSLTMLDLGDNDLGALPDGIFDGLTSLTMLDLDGNNLSMLPVGVLDPVLDTVTDLILDSTLTGVISFEHAAGAIAQGDNTVVRIVRTQPYTAVTVTVNTGGSEGSHVTAPGEITLSAGATSAIFEVTIGSASSVNGTATLALGALSLPADTREPPNAIIVSSVAVVAETTNVHTLDILPPDGICDRTEQVRNAIVAALVNVANCGVVTEDDLSEFTGRLALQNMGISTLKAGDFDGLTGLSNLRLDRNRLSTLPSTVFSDLRNLNILSLNSNNLSTLLDGLFDNTRVLGHLFLSDNQLTTLSSTVFSNLGGIISLSLDSNNLNELPVGIFNSLNRLVDLRLNNNNLTTLPGGIFSNLGDITNLSLSSNNLNELPGGIFNSLNSVRTLGLSNNNLNELPAGLFSDMSRLQNLTLNNNNLTTLPDGLFDSLLSLDSLALNDNNLETLSGDLFFVASPRLLLLNNNNLTTLPADLFDVDSFFPFRRVNHLFLNDNNLMNLPPDVFDNLNSLVILTLDGNPNLDTLPVGVLDPVLDTLGDDGSIGDSPGFLTLGSTLTDLISFEHAAGVIAQGGNTMVRIVRTQPHTAVTAIIGTGGDQSSHVTAPDEIILPAGATSATFEVTIDRAATVNGMATLTLGALSLPADTREPPNADIAGVIAVASTAAHVLAVTEPDGICDRTSQVWVVIVDAIGDGIVCGDVTDDHLGDLTGSLNFRNMGLSTLKAGDFDDLTGLTELRLNNSTENPGIPNNLETLPDGLFDDLSSLTRLDLSNNNLGTLPAGVFDELTELTQLGLNQLNLESLDSALFDNLARLVNLGVAGNNLAALPGDLFHNLPALRVFRLEDNANPALTELPAGLFDRSSALTWLRLNRTALTSLRADVFNGLDSLDRLSIDGNAGLTELPAGVLDPVLNTVTRLTLSSTLTGMIFFEDIAGDIRQDDARGIRVIRTQPYVAVTVPVEVSGTEPSGRATPTTVVFPAGATSAFIDVTTGPGAVSGNSVILTLGQPRLSPHGGRPIALSAVQAIVTVSPSRTTHTLTVNELFDICGRTKQVQDAIILSLVPGGTATCGNIPTAFLPGIRGTFSLAATGEGEMLTLQTDDFDDLTGIEELLLNRHNLQALPFGLFDDLSSLVRLDLSGGNNLPVLPGRLFDGLEALTELRLSAINLTTLDPAVFTRLDNLELLHLDNNPGLTLPTGVLDPVLDTLTDLRLDAALRDEIAFARTGSNLETNAAVTISLTRTTPHTTVVVPIAKRGDPDDYFTVPPTVTLPAGEVTVTFTVSAGERTDLPRAATLTLSVSSPAADGREPPNQNVFDAIVRVVSGVHSLTGPEPTRVCSRTPQVRDAIVAGTGVQCEFVTAEQLAGIIALDFRNTGITTLASEDFAGLIVLDSLDLSNNRFLTDLPAGIFNEVLDTLTTLNIDDGLKGRLTIEGPSVVELRSTAEIIIRRDPAFVAVNVPVSVAFSDGASSADFGGLASQTIRFDNDGTSTVITVATSTAAPDSTLAFTFGTPALLAAGGSPSPVSADSLLLLPDPPGDVHTLIVLGPRIGLEVVSEAGETGNRVAIVEPPDDGNGPNDTATITITVSSIPAEATGLSLDFTLEISGDSTQSMDVFVASGGNTYSPGPGSVTIDRSQFTDTDASIASVIITITALSDVDGDNEIVALTVTGVSFSGAAGDNLSDLSNGVTVVIGDYSAGICNRTEQVQTAILSAIPGVNLCFDVTPGHLAGITALTLDGVGIESLKVFDFDGLTNLESLDLGDTPDLAVLPVGIFDGVLDTLTALNIDDHLKGRLSIEGATFTRPGMTVNVTIVRSPAFVAAEVPVNITPGGDATIDHFLGLMDRTIEFDNDDTSTNITVVVDSGAPEDNGTLTFTFGEIALLDADGSSSTVSADSLLLLPDDIHTLTLSSKVQIGVRAVTEAGEESAGGENELTLIEDDNNNGANDMATVTYTFSNLPAGVTRIRYSFSITIFGDPFGGFSLNPGISSLHQFSVADGETTAGLDVMLRLRNDDNDTDGILSLTLGRVQLNDGNPPFGAANLQELPRSSCGSSGRCFAPPQQFHFEDNDTGICDRTQQVQNAIVLAIEDIIHCFNVTPNHLAGFTELTLADTGIRSLQSFDFDGLTTLNSLDLSDNPSLTVLPAGIFDEVLDTLTVLNIDDHLKGRLSIEGPSVIRAGSTARIIVRSSPAFVAVNVPVSVAFGGGADSEDFSGLPDQPIRFDNDDTSTAITVTALQAAGLDSTVTFTFGTPTLLAADSSLSRVSADSLILLPDPPGGDHTLTVFGTQVNVEAASEAGETGDRLTLVETDFGVDGPNDTATIMITISNMPEGVDRLEIDYTLEVSGDISSTNIFVAWAGNRTNAEQGRVTIERAQFTNSATAGTAIRVIAGHDDDEDDETAVLTVTGVTVVVGGIVAAGERVSGLPSTVTIAIEDNDAGICTRTEQVREAIISTVEGGSECYNVTSEHLAGVTALPLAGTGIESLRDGDFAGLANLESLDLSGNLLTGGLPTGIFDGVLDTLTTLDIDDRLKGRLSIEGRTSVAPGGMARITIVRDPAFVAVNVPVNVAFGGDAVSGHFTGLPSQPMEFDNDDTSMVITVAALSTAVMDSTLAFTFGTSALLAADSSPSRVPANSLILLPDPPGDVHTLTVFGPRVGLEAVSEAGETGNRVTIAEPGADGGGSNDTATITITVGSIPAAATGLSFDYTLEISGDSAQSTDVSIAGGGNTYSPGPGSVTIARSQFTGANTDTASTVITITALNDVDSDNEDLTLTVTGVSFFGAENENLSDLSNSVTILIGDNAAGICTRTRQVHEAIVSAIPDISHCFNVTPVHLADIITLTLADTGIELLRDGDFAGLSALESVDLSGNRALTGLVIAGIFDEVQDTLTTLTLTNTGIESLQEGVFAGFDILESLDLGGVPLPGGLPVGIFDGVLDTLTTLDVDDRLKGRLSIGGGTLIAARGMAARITIRRSPAFVAVNVSVNVTFGGGTGREDFTGLPDQPIEFDNDDTTAVITVSALATARQDSTLVFTFGTSALLAADSSPSEVSADSLILPADPPGDVHTLRVFGPRVELEAVSEAGEIGNRVSIVEPDDDGEPNDTATITVTVSNIPEEATGLSLDFTLEISGDSAFSTDVSIVGGGNTYNPGPGRVTLDGSQITGAATASTVITVTALNDDDGADEELTLTVTGVSFFGAENENLSGLLSSATILIGDSDDNICDRTEEVRTAIILAIPGESICSGVIPSDLAGLTALTPVGVPSLKDGDFDDLNALESLDLSGTSDLTVLPTGIFDEVRDTLTTLTLTNTGIEFLQADVFAGFDVLNSLDLRGNPDLTGLPVGIFDEVLDTLTTLNIDDGLKGRLFIEGPSFIRAGSMVRIIVRSSPAFVAVNVPVNVTFGGGAGSADFSGLASRTMEFDNDDTSTVIAVTTSPTAMLDGTAAFAFGTLTLLDADGIRSRVSADSLILPADPPGDAHILTISQTQVNVEAVSEAGDIGDGVFIVEADVGGNETNDTATITIIISNMPDNVAQVRIDYTLDISGDASEDNISVTSGDNTYSTREGGGRVIIQSAQFTNPTTASTAITVIARHDDDEDDETVVLTVTGVTVAADERVSGLPSTATILIEDNDAGICTRTRQVHEAIVSAVEGVSQCYNVTPAHLDDITTLTLTSTGIQFLQDGDFAGLTTLESLDLSGNPLNVLPAGIFDEVLDTLTTLNIDDRLKGRLSIEGGTSVAPGATVTITIRRSPAFVAVNVPVIVEFIDASSADFGGLLSRTIEFDNDDTSTDIMVTTSPTATPEGKARFTFGTLVFPDFDGNRNPVSRESLILLPDSPHVLVVGNIVRLRLRVFLEGALQ